MFVSEIVTRAVGAGLFKKTLVYHTGKDYSFTMSNQRGLGKELWETDKECSGTPPPPQKEYIGMYKMHTTNV